jgi:hypothetical protein
MLTVGQRVKYVGKESGNGYPYSGETGRVVQTAGNMVKVNLRDGVNVNLSEDNWKSAPIAIPITGYSLLAIAAIIFTWKTFK